ncbi:MAG: hypothetical protein NVSMB6_32340 [Burkholderiaceae bacterium]
MQFGKYHGFALIGLGILLLVLQATLFFMPKKTMNIPQGSAQQDQKTSPVPGVLGAASLLAGTALYISHRNRTPK